MRASLALWAAAGVLWAASLAVADANAGVGFHPHGMPPHMTPHPGFPGRPGFPPHHGFGPFGRFGHNQFARHDRGNRFNDLGLLGLFGGDGYVVSQTPTEQPQGGAMSGSIDGAQVPASSFATPEIIVINTFPKTARPGKLPVVIYGDPPD
jgi:hypothetical protein